MPIVHDNLASTQVYLITHAFEIFAELFKDVLEAGLELKGRLGALLVKLIHGMLASIELAG